MIDAAMFQQAGFGPAFFVSLVLSALTLALAVKGDNPTSVIITIVIGGCALLVAYVSRSAMHEVLCALLNTAALISASVIYGAEVISKVLIMEGEMARSSLSKLQAPPPTEFRPAAKVANTAEGEYRGVKYARHNDLSVSSEVDGEIVTWPNIMAFKADVNEYLDKR